MLVVKGRGWHLLLWVYFVPSTELMLNTVPACQSRRVTLWVWLRTLGSAGFFPSWLKTSDDMRAGRDGMISFSGSVLLNAKDGVCLYKLTNPAITILLVQR